MLTGPSPIAGITEPGELRWLNQAYPSRYPFLLQSTARDGKRGRFDILFAFPGEELVLDRLETLSGPGSESTDNFLAGLDEWWRREKTCTRRADIPFMGGWFVYLGYELAAQIEPSLELRPDSLLPTAFAVRCPSALIYDHDRNSCEFILESDDQVDQDQLRHDIRGLPKNDIQRAVNAPHVREEDPAVFTAAVEAAKEFIAAGDIYQANLSRKWTADVAADLRSEQIYAALCNANPGSFAGIAHWRGSSIISSSPERLLDIRNGQISTRPIAGTRPRGSDSIADDNLLDELIAHPKERAEHVMLIDLERSDLGRVCEAGSVEVDEFMVLESYAHVHHIVSNIRGQLRADVTPGKAIAAVFPGGTITGCPKVRCMEIINSLEASPRGAYTGAFGYLDRNGDMDLSILIRTIVRKGREVTFSAGSGIVADSVPKDELEETRAKAKGMLRALRSD